MHEKGGNEKGTIAFQGQAAFRGMVQCWVTVTPERMYGRAVVGPAPIRPHSHSFLVTMVPGNLNHALFDIHFLGGPPREEIARFSSTSARARISRENKIRNRPRRSFPWASGVGWLGTRALQLRSLRRSNEALLALGRVGFGEFASLGHARWGLVYITACASRSGPARAFIHTACASASRPSSRGREELAGHGFDGFADRADRAQSGFTISESRSGSSGRGRSRDVRECTVG